ncbi:M23 family metallopeptidase [Patescibacteria group bacterium]|nr:M23 family metallopeptidase [Patescibacteria group bacterium]
MRFRKKKLLFFLIFTLSVFAFFILSNSPLAANFEAFAQDLEVEYPTIPGAPLSAEPTLPEYIKFLYNFSIIIAGLVAFFSLVYGGLRYMFSVGSPAAMADARDQITAGILGLIILLGSYLFLVIVNPQLAVFRLDAPLPEIVTVCGNNRCELGEYESCPEDCTQIELTAITFRVYEIPIGQLIENALEPVRLSTITAIASQISNDSGILKNKAEEFWNLLNQCSCNNTNPTFSCVASGLGQACPAPLPPPTAQCVNDPCPNRAGIIAAKNALPGLADNLAATIETMLPPLTSLKKDEQRLEIGAEIFNQTIFPVNYDSFLETKQTIIQTGKEIKVIPFVVLGQRTRGLGDPATFYTDEEEISSLLAGGRFPAFPRFDTLAVCDECKIDIHYSSPELISFLKGRKGEFVSFNPEIDDGSCPGGKDCWDYVIDWADTNGWNPAFILALWKEEGGWDRDGIACPPGGGNCSVLGCLDGTSNIVDQLSCFAATTDPATGNCGPSTCSTGNNNEFCGFMRCWSGGPNSCLLSGVGDENPDFWTVFFDIYMDLIPAAGEEQLNPAAPSGNCTTFPSALPPGLAGCPLDPESFSFSGGWHSYCRADGYYHDGMDLGTVRGAPVYAVADGNAFGLGSDGHGLGFYVILQATNPQTGESAGIFVYAHLTETSHTDVAPDIPAGGRVVSKGDLIGFVDDTGHSFGDHLHFAYYPNGVIHSLNALPIECLGIECISVTSASNLCTDFAVQC